MWDRTSRRCWPSRAPAATGFRCTPCRCASPAARRRSPVGWPRSSTRSASTATCTRAPPVPPTTTTLTRIDAAGAIAPPDRAMRAAPGGGGDRVAELAVGPGVVLGLRRGARIAPRVLATGAVVRAALVPTQAGPLAGDHDRVRVRVEAGGELASVPGAGRRPV